MDEDGALTGMFTPAQREILYDIYLDTVLEGIGEGNSSTTHLRKDLYPPKMRAAINRGSFLVDPVALIIEKGWAISSERSAGNTNNMIKEIVDGQTTLTVADWLDLPVTIGNVRRTTIRYLSKEDWTVIVAIRQKNHDDAGSVLASAERAARLASTELDTYGSMEKAVILGGLLHTAPPAAAGGVAV